MNIKTIASIAALATLTGCVAAPPASAEHINGYEVIVVDSGRYDQADSITVWGPQGVESISVTCAPFDWKSHGANTAEFVDSIARSWCF